MFAATAVILTLFMLFGIFRRESRTFNKTGFCKSCTSMVQDALR